MANRDPSSPTPMPTIFRYSIAVLSVAFAIVLGLFVLRHFEAILTPFLFAVAATVWYAGAWPGVLAIVLSVLSLNYFFLRPVFSFSPISYADLIYLTFCIFCALAVGWVSAVRRRAEQELRQAREELEAKVVERTADLQRSEGYLAETQKLTRTGTWAWDARSQRVLYCSEEMFRIYGLDPQKDLPTRKNFRQRVHPEDRSRTDARFARVVNEKVDSFDEYRVLLPDGTVKHVISSGHPVLDGNGDLIAFIGTATDVTERKRAEEALREREAKIRRLVDSNIIGIFFTGLEGRVLEANDAFLHLVGQDRDDLVSGRIRWTDLTPPEWRERDKRALAELSSNTIARPYEKEFFRKDGSRVPVLVGGALFEEGGDEGVAFVLDLTERKRVEDALREREVQLAEARRELRQMINTIPIPVASYSADARRDFVNAAWKQYTGLSDEAALGTEWSVVAHPDHIAIGEKVWRDALAAGEPWHTEERVRRADGQYRWFAIDRVAARDENGKVIKWYGTAYDIEDRKRAEDALRESEYRLRQIIETVPGLLWSLAPDGEPTYFNQRFLDYFGKPFEDFKHGGWLALIHPDDVPETERTFSHAIQTGSSYQGVLRFRRADGEYRWHEGRGEPLRDRQGNIVQWYGLSVDIDEAKKAEDRLRRSESYLAEAQLELAHANRVATMGQLTASITHEVNQPITAAVTYALAARRFLSAKPPNFREVDEALSLIVKEGNRAGEVVGRVRALIKKAPARKDAVEINDAILEVIALTRREAANNSVSVRTQLAEGLPRVQGDRVQLQQVLLNLIINAIEAMREIDEEERELLIGTRNEPEGVSVEVRDSGPGFASAALERAFEAFYTTKSDGLGLGLSICRSIIEAHNGRLWASPNVPRGAIFRFTMLPHSAAAP
nr:PAS domain S-box protein [Bradyrhizobium sp. th.b2]